MRIVFLCGMLLAVSIPAQGIEGLPGSSWGYLTHSVQGLTGSGGAGWINQGIDWTTLPGDIIFNTYAEYRFRARTEQKDYYNSEGPAIGCELKKSFFRLGMDYYWERFPELDTYSNTREFYLTGYYNWDLNTSLNTSRKPMPLGIIGFPGAVWANLTYDVTGLTGSSAMGWINQGIDWIILPGGITLNTYAEYRFRARTKEKDYYDAEGPVIGLEFKKSFFRLGMDYYWERFPKLGEQSHSLEFYLTWYVNWDLKRGRRE
jgi:hypothetical protein